MIKDLNIELFLLCFNEQKMIPHTLNYYAQFCSKITIFDNDSTDKSKELIRNFDSRIQIKRLDTGGEHREDILRDTRNTCWKESTADYVIVCDMDEFLYHPSLVNQLKIAKEKRVAIPVVVGYNMIADSFPEDHSKLITEQVQVGYKDRRFDKNIIFDPKQVKEINFRPGSHLCNPKFHEAPVLDALVEFKLLHYKYLDKEYLYNRHEMYSQRLSIINKNNKWGAEYLDGNQHIDTVYDTHQYLIQVID